MAEENAWLRRKAEEPGHTGWYVQRFRDLAARGEDLAGEARLIDAMVPRGARILDAGSGTGRVGAFLHAAGHEVVGVDFDPELVAVAEQDHPGPSWLVGDLAELDLPAPGFDAVVCAGNVIAFVAPSTRVEILRRFKAHLREGGRVVVGFGAGRGYAFEDFLADAAAAGLSRDVLLSTWDLRPFTPESEFLVAVLS
ncbi:methyltransferase domain-containing protein [Dactylosporangium sp. NPDC000244]|uniref:class I SAM-dependent methyltransferase n=1 Tax=Dactylosporangium sp. NPDC000244 TaxID=3154365 RepID=UPI00332332EE